MKLTAAREDYLAKRIPEILSRYEGEKRRRQAFSRRCGSKEERQAYCKKHSIRGKEMEVILNIHRCK